MAAGTIEKILFEVEDFLSPITTASEPEEVIALLEDISIQIAEGQQLSALFNLFADIRSSIAAFAQKNEQIKQVLNDPNVDYVLISKIVYETIGEISKIISIINRLPSIIQTIAPSHVDADLFAQTISNIVAKLINLLLYRYIKNKIILKEFLEIIDMLVVEQRTIQSNSSSIPNFEYVYYEFVPANIPKMIKEPIKYFSDLLKAKSLIILAKLLSNIVKSINIPIVPDEQFDNTYHLPGFDLFINTSENRIELICNIVNALNKFEHDFGAIKLAIGTNLLKENVVISFNQNGTFLIEGIPTNIEISPYLELTKNGNSEINLFNSAILNLGQVSLRLAINTSNQTGKLGIEGILTMVNGYFQLKASVFDGFIKNIIPSDIKISNLNLSIGYSNLKGFHFSGSGGLDLQLAQNIPLGPIQLLNSYFSIKFKADSQSNDSGLRFIAGTNIAAKLGPLNVNIEELGFKMEVTFPNDANGNLGLIDLKPGFKFPTGVALSLDTGTVIAGGYLHINQDAGEYFGAIEIKIIPINLAIKAIGIINTKFPGTQEQNFSLLIIITVEFSPVQLGFGFTLEGVGGLFGYKRTMQTDVLREGLKNKTLDSILFPKDVIKNINKVVTDLKSVFPATQEERFLIGPMAKLGWGGSKVTAEIGIIMELPDPVQIAILGVVRIILPDDKAEILKLQINFLGVIDFAKKLISIDANLEDSRLLKTMTLTGQFALRIGWGSNPLFIFSAGGFHPDFKEAPAELQKMTRMGIVIIDRTDLKLRVESYFALTTNTLQFGARAFCFAKFDPYIINAAAGFDVLIQFNPFHFSAKVFLSGRATGPLIDVVVEAEANLTGPNVWHLWGFARVKLVVEILIPFNVSFGEAIEELAPETIDVLDLLKKEVAIDANWTAQTQGGGISPKVTLRQLPVDSGIVLHPNTSLSFNQRTVPLKTGIQKFGNKVPQNRGGSFKIAEISVINPIVGSSSKVVWSNPQDLYDTFAPGHFFDIPKEQQLSRRSFESFISGVSFNIGPSLPIKGNYIPKTDADQYELVYIKKKPSKSQLPAATYLKGGQLRMLAGGGAAAKSNLSYENNRTSYQAPETVIKTEQSYMVASKKDLNSVDGTTSYKNQTEAYEMQKSEMRDKDYNLVNQENTIILSTYE